MQYSKELKIGAVILAAFIVFVFGLRFFQDIPFFQNSYPMHAKFEDAGGLSSGNPVRIKGVNVGTVESVRLDHDEQVVRVDFTVREETRIPKGSYAEVSGFSEIGGVRLTIHPGPQDNPPLPPGSTLPPPPEGNILDRLSDRAPVLAAKADSVLTSTNATLRGLGQQLQNPQSDLRQTLESLRKITNSLEDVTTAEENTIQDLLQNLEAVSEDLRAFTGDNGDSLDVAVQRLNQSLVRLNRGLASFEKTTATLDEVATKMNSGNGTVARLLNDPSLYTRLDSAAAQTNRLLLDLQERPGRYLQDMTLVKVF